MASRDDATTPQHQRGKRQGTCRNVAATDYVRTAGVSTGWSSLAPVFVP